MDWLLAPVTAQLIGALLVIGAMLHLASALLQARRDAARARTVHDQRLRLLDRQHVRAAGRVLPRVERRPALHRRNVAGPAMPPRRSESSRRDWCRPATTSSATT